MNEMIDEVINVDTYHTQKGVYTAKRKDTETERTAWHHGNVMRTKEVTELTVK